MKRFYIDGSTRIKNQKNIDNIGGWGVVCFADENEDKIIYCEYDSETRTTNNRMELKALLTALYYINDFCFNETVVIYTDSAYVEGICNKWWRTWAQNTWHNSKKQPVENLDLILEIIKFLDQDFCQIKIKKIKGHAEIVGNEMADALATGSFSKFEKLKTDFNIVQE